METGCTKIVPHPQLLEALFAFRSKVSSVFRDVLGLYEIGHMAVTRINVKQEILVFSSTPALEFNLFTSNLWHFDQTYHPNWFRLCTQANWQELYSPSRYDELYYLKQIKHHYPIGKSIAALIDNDFFIYSLARVRSCKHTQELFANQSENFYKIGQYCTNRLSSLFLSYDDTLTLSNTQVEYEASN